MTAPTTLAHIDYQAFAAELDQLVAKARQQMGEADLHHLRKIERWGRLSSLLGYLTAWMCPNPVSAWLISQGSMARWAMVTHHVSHRGYDRIPGVPKRYHSKYFAQGWRRFLDWPEWMVPDAWNFEHNTLHHYHTGESMDPDVLEHNVRLMREINAPVWLKYAVSFFFMSTWKLTYYAPNTLWCLQQVRKRQHQGKASGVDLAHLMTQEKVATYHGAKLWNPFYAGSGEFWRRCVLPYGTLRFGLLPLLFFPLGGWAWANVLINSLLAEWFTNLHSFAIIVPNHAGDDVYRFETPISDKAEFYVRQVVGSVNYPGGTNVKDFLQGWLNYQIEHHLWPDLSMLQYQRLQPQVQALCEQYGVPYVQENVFKRLGRTLRIMVGKLSMPVATTLSRQQRQSMRIETKPPLEVSPGMV